MKISTLFILLFFSALALDAQDYLINFSCTGSSTTVETVTVENLTQGKSIKLSGSKTLRLMGTVTANTPLLEYMDYPLIVYPNPSSGDLTMQFEAQKSGSATIVLVDISGREINRLQQRVQNGSQSFKVAGLSNGVYTVQVLLEDQSFSKKVICNGKSTSKATITYKGFSSIEQNIHTLKSATDQQTWQYNTGDRLKFQGTSGKYSTIVMDIPTQSKTIPFNFVECTDADGNNYPVVQIGNQLWMAENLKTTKYNDGTPIPNEPDNLKWANLTTGAYCWQNNDINNKATFGALYNWFAVGTNKVAPTGWHVASNLEWAELINYVSGKNWVNENIAGDILKESDGGFNHWIKENSNPSNDFGFSALPGGMRLVNKPYNLLGSFQNLGVQSVFWSKSEIDNTFAWGKELWYSDSKIKRYWSEKQSGFSVRCIKDIPVKPSEEFITKAPKYTYPNNTIGQIKNGYFYPGYYVISESSFDKYDIYGIFSKELNSWPGAYFSY